MSSYQLKTQTIYCGDNLKMLKDVPDESVDLIYIDPPFNSNRNYEVFWGDSQEKRAFNDRFGDVTAYIDYMRPRVVEHYRVLKKTGSFYYHCDWHASHYVKIMLDQIFGFNNFRNEIIWHYGQRTMHNKYKYNSKHDTIFFYAKTKAHTLNIITESWTKEEISSTRARKILKDENGEEYIWDNRSVSKGYPAKKQYIKDIIEKGKAIDSVWDIPFIGSTAEERLGYPTQKPIALLERIINASSNKGDTVLDGFCGCGTTLIAAQKLNRKWIGIDISPTACRVMADRLYNDFKLEEGKDFFVRDLRKTEEELINLPHFEFQNWAVIALGGIPSKVLSGDYGIDGKLYPIDFAKKKTEGKDLFGEADIYYPIQVKQKEKAGRPDIDSFETAIRRDGRRKGYFVAFGFTKDAIAEMKRLDKEGEIEIIPITVNELLKRE